MKQNTKFTALTFLLALGVLAGSCSKSETESRTPGGTPLKTNFVLSYIVPDYYVPLMTTLRGGGREDDGQRHPIDHYTFVMESNWADLKTGMDGEPRLVDNWQSGATKSTNLYLQYSKENGEAGPDVAERGSYKGRQTLEKVVPVQVKGITVTANRDFDRDHPAGSDLTALFGIRYVWPGDYIHSGYSELYTRKYGIPGYDNMTEMVLTDFNARQFTNLGHRLELYLLSKPANMTEGITFTFTYRDVDGHTHTMQSEPVAIH